MPSQDIRVSATTPASPETVYALLRDGASWPEWSPLGSFELERPAGDEPEGVGAIRIFRTGRVTSREQIVAWHSSFDPKVPGTGWLYRHQLRRFIKRLVDGLARRAQEHTSP